MMKYLPLLTIAVITFSACNQHNGAPVYVWLKSFKQYDSSRTFDTTKTSHNIYRPVKIDVFYPSTIKPSTAELTWGDILDMYGQRFDFNNPPDSCKKISAQIVQATGDYFHIDTPAKLLSYKTGIYYGMAQPRQKLPLIVYASSMNGSSWENTVLFDSLATHGYVVAVVSSVGKYPGYMSEAVDLNEQVRDILYTIGQMKALPFVDGDKIGIASWSLGGLAAMKAAMISPDIKCISSFDGNDIHAYGNDTAWDREYNEMRSLPPYTPGAIAVPYMYLCSEHPRKIDSIYNPILLTASPGRYFLKFKDAIHEDFSCIPVIAKLVQPSGKDIHTQYHTEINKLDLMFFDEYLKNESSKNVGAYINRLVSADGAHYNNAPPVY